MDVANISESDIDDDVADELTLHAPDGAFGVLRIHPPLEGWVLVDWPEAVLSTASGYLSLVDDGAPEVDPVRDVVDEYPE